MTKTTLAKVSWILGSTSIITGGAAAGTLSAKTEDVVLKTSEDSQEVEEETDTVTEVVTPTKVARTKKPSAFAGVKKLTENLKTLDKSANWSSFTEKGKKNFIQKNQSKKDQFIDAWDNSNSGTWEKIYKERYSKSKQKILKEKLSIFSVFSEVNRGFVEHAHASNYRSLNNACWAAYWMDIKAQQELDIVWFLCSVDGIDPNR
ncbi:hypothetical protein [Candidatus Mycoplasma haematohominis]|uniref:hypothetical protein n=1 Tax=Candidatus Mycoplasma haematohominis TaxID=1494318 RepID=UPI001C0A76B9|nr:hypothetical protein [Candidatus Mycoplasma haemohominis]